MQEAKKFALDVGITFIASILNVIFASLIGILLGRYLGPTDLGLYKMTVMFYGIASLIGALGIPASMIKYVAEYKKDKIAFNKIVSSGLITSLVMGLILSMLIYSYSFLFASLFKMPELESLLSLLSPVFFFVLLNAGLFGILN